MTTTTFPYQEITGAIHLHTLYSDGGVSYEELIDAAQGCGLDYVVVTDHMNLKGREAGYEKFHGNLMVLVGYEHNDPKKLNHYLAIGTNKAFPQLQKPQQYIDAVRENGGIGFLAHPAEKRNYFGNLPPYPWTEWDATGYDGIELWNQMSDWIENIRSWRSFIRLLYPRRFLGNVPDELLEKWDKLNQNRFISGVGGVDAHTRRISIGPFAYTIFPIKVELKGIRTHLYIPQKLPEYPFDEARSLLLKALKNGNGFISNYRRGDAKGTQIYLRQENGAVLPPGLCGTINRAPAMLCVQVPSRGNIRLIRNGVVLKSVKGTSAQLGISDDGVYRVEVYKGKNAWIYSNPFHVLRQK
ncbi:histidinol phosphatase [Chitinispirillum alkaliphilum]|nr:histidinol phosphatase [Chitinispirillum alkaliphilum]